MLPSPIATRIRPGAPAPSEPPGPEPQAKICSWSSSLPWLHSLESWSLRQTRRGSVENGVFAGGPFDWLSVFSLVCGFGVVAGYGLLGACWLMIRTDHDIEDHARRFARIFLVAVGLFAVLVSLWTPFLYDYIWARWFSVPNIFLLWPLPVVTAALGLLAWRSIARGDDVKPFFLVIGIFLLCFLGLGISIFPYLVPPSIDLWQAAAAPASLEIMLIGVGIMLPLIFGYTAFVYWTFRGKLREGETYH